MSTYVPPCEIFTAIKNLFFINLILNRFQILRTLDCCFLILVEFGIVKYTALDALQILMGSSLGYSEACEVSVLTAMSMKVAVLLDVAACSLVDVSGRFRGSYCFHAQV